MLAKGITELACRRLSNRICDHSRLKLTGKVGQFIGLKKAVGAAGYTEAARWSSRYLQQDLYTWLDPAFASDLYMGAIGFRVYVRDDLVTRDRAPGAGPR